MNYLVFDLFLSYLISNNKYNNLAYLRRINLDFKSYIDNNILYQRKKYAFMLTKVIDNFQIDFNSLTEIITNKQDFKYMLTCIYNIGSSCDFTFHYYKRSLMDYNVDKFHPLKKMRFFKYIEIKKKMKTSIMLNLALSHAEKPYSIAKTKELWY